MPMTDKSDEKSRIEDLQVKVAFLEESLSQISDEFFTQQKELEEVKKQRILLDEKLRNLQNTDQEHIDIVDEKPPHY